MMRISKTLLTSTLPVLFEGVNLTVVEYVADGVQLEQVRI